ncbi:mast cell protease 1A-like [Erpetoichthys calabaricus]|uniref:Mast cell protease 1A-like n=1 Tax=Erpetoichthys calabaricus TaxID=27687 RepID=A0A8C4TC05_ERPCA|nr:mast cell protease 1A-like [Erpetoichthys calabaricus]
MQNVWTLRLLGVAMRPWHCMLTIAGLVITLTCNESFAAVIINGQEAHPHSRPYMASVQINEKHKCGGFLIDKYFVMTAAHCRDKNRTLTVVLGAHRLSKIQPQWRFSVEDYYPHPNYQRRKYENDIMLLKLVKPAVKIQDVKEIKLAKTDKNGKPGSLCEVSGWGATPSSRPSTERLQVANVTVIDEKKCRHYWKEHYLPNVLCTGGTKRSGGFCQGDSGGPLVCQNLAVGVVSFRHGKNCDNPETPNVYTKISRYLKWIQKTIKQF